jgi:hypothetical protein
MRRPLFVQLHSKGDLMKTFPYKDPAEQALAYVWAAGPADAPIHDPPA